MFPVPTFRRCSCASFVPLSERRPERNCPLVSIPLSQLSSRWNFCSICRSLARALLRWDLVSPSRAWYEPHSCWTVSKHRSSNCGTPQGITCSRVTSSVLSRAWPSVQCTCSSWRRIQGISLMHIYIEIPSNQNIQQIITQNKIYCRSHRYWLTMAFL